MRIRTTKLQASAVALAVVGLAALPVRAEESSQKHESIGLASGLVVGALAGGPLGAILGGAAGGWLGDRYWRQVSAKEALAADLGRSEAERERLARSLADIGRTLREMESRSLELDHALDRVCDLETDVRFRTADAQLAPETVESLRKLGALVQSLPEVQVRVAGHADPRGSEEYNAELSRRRAEAVASVLAEAGLTPERLIVEAHGERAARSAEGDLDGHAFDRRVSIRIEPAGDALAQAR